MHRVWQWAICCVTMLGYASAAQNGQVEISDGRWVISVRVPQDRAAGSESGFGIRIATTIAAQKILDFGCKLKSGAGERVSGQIKGLVTLGSKETDEWAEVVVAAPVQPLKCKLEKLLVFTEGSVGEQGSPASAPEPMVFRELKTDY